MRDYAEQFAECSTIEAVNKLSKEMQRERSDAAKQRRKEINAELQAPYHDEAKRWKHGDKVYFGKSDNRSGMSFNDRIQMHRYYDIKAGQWCRVWEYQSRKKIAWLCQPGKPLKYENIIDHGFTLRDLQDADVSRVEPEIRKKAQESQS
jgi:hypothetical protein